MGCLLRDVSTLEHMNHFSAETSLVSEHFTVVSYSRHGSGSHHE